jgi:Fe-S-cluster containining protein
MALENPAVLWAEALDLQAKAAMADDLKQWVLAAAGQSNVRMEVRRLYEELQVRIDQRRPVCVMSGRCCRFDEYGHRLYVTTIELGAFMAELADLPQAGPNGTDPGLCPLQSGKICRVHSIRPMGCRIFFCDPSSIQWQQDVYEEFHSRLKELHRELSIPYAYVEWRFACRTLGLYGRQRGFILTGTSASR